jgi:hypothetical protein
MSRQFRRQTDEMLVLTQDLLGGEPAPDVPAEHAAQEVLGLGRDGGEGARREAQVPAEHGLEDLPRGGAGEGHGPGEHHVEHDPGAPDVHLLGVLPAGHHLGRDVVGRPDQPRHGPAVPEPGGGAEVPEPERAAGGGVEEEVVGLDVAVRDPAAVAAGERVGELRHQLRRLGLRERAPRGDEREQVPARAQVQHQVHGVGVHEGGVQRDHVAAGGRRQVVHLGLLLRQRQVQRVRPQRRLGRRLERERLPRGGGVAAADRPEPAAPDLLADHVLPPQRLLRGAAHARTWSAPVVWCLCVLGEIGLGLGWRWRCCLCAALVSTRRTPFNAASCCSGGGTGSQPPQGIRIFHAVSAAVLAWRWRQAQAGRLILTDNPGFKMPRLR